MVALRMEPDPTEPLPFAVGEIIRINGPKIVVRWYGQVRQNAGMTGTWKPGYVTVVITNVITTIASSIKTINPTPVVFRRVILV
jgi:hypothetical protein